MAATVSGVTGLELRFKFEVESYQWPCAAYFCFATICFWTASLGHTTPHFPQYGKVIQTRSNVCQLVKYVGKRKIIADLNLLSILIHCYS